MFLLKYGVVFGAGVEKPRVHHARLVARMEHNHIGAVRACTRVNAGIRTYNHVYKHIAMCYTTKYYISDIS